jgi:translation elongation factor EF-Tu-like GTPase
MESVNLKAPEIEAEIYYLTTEEGGRKSYVGNGYRGQFYYNGRDWDAPQEFINKERCELGDTVRVFLRTCSPENHIGKFYVGQQFEIREGAKTVGRGTILKILRSDFIRNS